jgi:uncharacterized protein (DUF983 family)
VRIYQPDDFVPHIVGLIVVAVALVGWTLVARTGIYVVIWTHTHHWKPQTLRDILFGIIPTLGILLCFYCLFECTRKGFGFLTTTLALCLFFGMLTDGFLLMGAMTAGI